MREQIFKKGVTYTCDCIKCGHSMFSHEWATWGHNEMRDTMENGTAQCPECGGMADKETFRQLRPMYAGRYSMPGYLDATEIQYDGNLRRLRRTLRDLYGNPDPA